MALHAESPDGERLLNTPETYELFEGGWIDRATEFLGFGRWAIGRPGKNSFSRRQQATPRPSHVLPAPSNVEHRPSVSFDDVVGELVPSSLPKSRNYSDNAIVHKKALIVGAMGKGKTKLLESMAESVARRATGEGRRFVGFRETASIGRTLEDGTKTVSDVWFFANDDLTLARISPVDVQNYYQLRHVIARNTGLREGLVVTAMGVHRFYGLDLNLGAEFDQLWVKSIPKRPSDRNTLLSYFDHIPPYRRNGGPCHCQACQFERMGQPNDKALVRRSNGESEIVDVPYPERSVLRNLDVSYRPRRVRGAGLVVGLALLAMVVIVWAFLIWLIIARLSGPI